MPVNPPRPPENAPVGRDFAAWIEQFARMLSAETLAAARFQEIDPRWQPLRQKLDRWTQAANAIVEHWAVLREYNPMRLGDDVPAESIQKLEDARIKIHADAERDLYFLVKASHRKAAQP